MNREAIKTCILHSNDDRVPGPKKGIKRIVPASRRGRSFLLGTDQRLMLPRMYLRMNRMEMMYTRTGTSLALPRATLMME